MSEIAKKDETLLTVLMEQVEDKIVTVREQQVLLDRDVAALYGVETREVNQAVRNNPGKFRKGYMFELTADESSALRSNFLTLEKGTGKGRHSKITLKRSPNAGYICLQQFLSPREQRMLQSLLWKHSTRYVS